MTEKDLTNIDNYFQRKLSAEESRAFEKRLSEDTDFAESVAFYANLKAISREQVLEERHSEWKNRKQPSMSFSKIAIGIAAMLVAIAGFWFFTNNNETITEKANKYIETNLMNLPKTMDATEDSLQIGIGLYNDKKYNEASANFEKLIDKTPKALEYAGLCALQTQQYDVAELYFEKLSQNTDLLKNNGKFYEALVFLKQGNERRGKALLEEVINENLGGKKEAEKILE